MIEIRSCDNCDCGGKRPIVNKKYGLCQEKNWERLHPKEGTLEENKRKKQTEIFSKLRENSKPLRTVSKPKQVSKKQVISNKELYTVYEEIDLEREHICSGCGQKNNLSHSHIIPKSRRKDLEVKKENIVYDCLSIGKNGCHDIWEKGTVEQRENLINFQERMEYIKSNDIEYYNLLIFKYGR